MHGAAHLEIEPLISELHCLQTADELLESVTLYGADCSVIPVTCEVRRGDFIRVLSFVAGLFTKQIMASNSNIFI